MSVFYKIHTKQILTNTSPPFPTINNKCIDSTYSCHKVTFDLCIFIQHIQPTLSSLSPSLGLIAFGIHNTPSKLYAIHNEQILPSHTHSYQQINPAICQRIVVNQDNYQSIDFFLLCLCFVSLLAFFFGR